MNTAKKLMLLMGGSTDSGEAAITYLYRDEYTTDLAAGSVNGTNAEPGPGARTVTDTGSLLSITGGVLFANGNTATSNPRLYTDTSFARAAGRTMFGTIRTSNAGSDRGRAGWHTANSATPTLHTLLAWSGRVTENATTIATPVTQANNTDYPFAFVLRSAGVFYFINISSTWLLYFVGVNSTATPLYAGFGGQNTDTVTWQSQYLHVRDLPAPFDTDNGIATLSVDSPVDATEYTGDADGIIDLTVTAPGSLDGSATTRCGFYYRADADLSPAWHCYVAGDGAFNVDSIASDGTRTNRITVAGVITNGATHTLRIICTGSLHDAYTLTTTAWTKRGSQVNVSLNNTATTIEPSVPAGWTVANLRSYPRTSAAYAELDSGLSP